MGESCFRANFINRNDEPQINASPQNWSHTIISKVEISKLKVGGCRTPEDALLQERPLGEAEFGAVDIFASGAIRTGFVVAAREDAEL